MLVNLKSDLKKVGGGSINKKRLKICIEIMHDSWESGDLGMLA